jgi:hypothetical protein
LSQVILGAQGSLVVARDVDEPPKSASSNAAVSQDGSKQSFS